MNVTTSEFHHRHTDTSTFAYQSTPESVRQKHKYMILNKICELSTATCSEIERCLNLSHQSASARICELKKENKIVDTGERRLTESGKPARVYALNIKEVK